VSKEKLVIHLDAKLTGEQVVKTLREVADRLEQGTIPQLPFSLEVGGEVKGQILIKKY
jgi:hypothetical protein